MKTIAIITARGGSKRIPKKNIKFFCGKPIIQYSIEAALNSGVFDSVMVSTEDEEIAAISRTCGAEVPFMRSKKMANDYAGTADVLLEVLESYHSKEHKLLIMPNTIPMVMPETEVQDIDNENDWKIAEMKYRMVHGIE